MPETIEAEVVSIDGKAPPERSPEPETKRSPWSRERVRGRLLQLDRRWWPLWVLLGIVVVALAIVIGTVVGIIAVLMAAIRSIGRLFTGGGGPGNGALRPR